MSTHSINPHGAVIASLQAETDPVITQSPTLAHIADMELGL